MDCIFFSFPPLFRRSHKKKIIKSILVECNAKAKIPWMIQQDSERKLSLWIIGLMMIIPEWNPFINGVQEQRKEDIVKISLSRKFAFFLPLFAIPTWSYKTKIICTFSSVYLTLREWKYSSFFSWANQEAITLPFLHVNRPYAIICILQTQVSSWQRKRNVPSI